MRDHARTTCGHESDNDGTGFALNSQQSWENIFAIWDLDRRVRAQGLQNVIGLQDFECFIFIGIYKPAEYLSKICTRVFVLMNRDLHFHGLGMRLRTGVGSVRTSRDARQSISMIIHRKVAGSVRISKGTRQLIDMVIHPTPHH